MKASTNRERKSNREHLLFLDRKLSFARPTTTTTMLKITSAIILWLCLNEWNVWNITVPSGWIFDFSFSTMAILTVVLVYIVYGSFAIHVLNASKFSSFMWGKEGRQTYANNKFPANSSYFWNVKKWCSMFIYLFEANHTHLLKIWSFRTWQLWHKCARTHIYLY